MVSLLTAVCRALREVSTGLVGCTRTVRCSRCIDSNYVTCSNPLGDTDRLGPRRAALGRGRRAPRPGPGAQGLRTLVLATRVLGEAEYAAWAEEHAAAAGSLDDREQRVAAVRVLGRVSSGAVATRRPPLRCLVLCRGRGRGRSVRRRRAAALNVAACRDGRSRCGPSRRGTAPLMSGARARTAARAASWGCGGARQSLQPKRSTLVNVGLG
jgi:hypothetical protein